MHINSKTSPRFECTCVSLPKGVRLPFANSLTRKTKLPSSEQRTNSIIRESAEEWGAGDVEQGERRDVTRGREINIGQ